MYSEPGKGATFHVYLPRIDKSPEPPGNLTAESFPKGTEHILLVDDEETIARLLKRMPERLGYRVTARTSSVEALQALRSQPVNRRSLILLSRTWACPICPVRIWPERF